MKRFVLVALAVLIAVPAMAQQYGSLAGLVVDNQKQALPGVSVTLSGHFMQGTRTAVTDAQGRYRFVPVPPGTGYAVKFELQGFNTLEKTDMVVAIAKETTINAEMSLSQFAETITVTAEKIVVDTTKSTVDTTVDWKLVDTLATNRNFQNMMQMAPGVKSGNNPLVHGASDDANIYMIDGVDTTDPRTQTWGTALNWDTIQEAQVQTAGFSAEFGRATGGIINLVTKSGGNNFSFTGRGIWQRVKWSADGGIEKETGAKKPGAGRSDETRPSLTLGGPIMKDGLWFYLAYEGRSNHRDYGYYATMADAQAIRQTTGRTNYIGHYISGKLTWQASAGHSLVGYYNEDPIKLDPLRAGWYSASYNPSMEQQQFQGGNNWSLQWYGILNPNFFMEGKYQKHHQELSVTPFGSLKFTQPYLYDRTVGYYSGGSYYDYQSNRDRDGVNLAASYYIDSAAGSHQIKGGLEYLKLAPEAGRIYNPLGYYQTSNAGATPYRRYFWFDQVAKNKTEQTYLAIYLQDQWKIGRLSLNVGVRADSTTIKQNKGKEVLKYGFGDEIAPRLGFAYDLKGDSIHGSLGRFYSLTGNYAADYFNDIPTHQQRWSWNKKCTADPAKKPWEYGDNCWTLDYDVPTAAGGTTLDKDMKPAYVDEATIGYDKLLSDRFAAGVNYVWRQQKRIQDYFDPTASGLAVLTNIPKSGKFMEYQAIEVNFKRRFGPDGIQFIANYTYVIKSNNWNQSGNNLFPNVFTNPDDVNDYWYGTGESPHDFKFNGSYTMPWKTVFGISAFWNSGGVYTATAPGNYQTVPLVRRGSMRVGSNWEADMHIEHPIRIGPFSIAAYADLFNAFNNQQVTTRRGQKYTDVAQTVPDSRFKQPTGWQSPRRWQFGFKIEY